MKLVVGLGNPGQKYRETRHNVGFEVIATLHRQFQAPRPGGKFNSEIAEIRSGTEKILLLSPLTFMNLSGQAVRAAMDFYKLPIGDLLVVCDDFNLPRGRLRLKPSGSAGGQNGLQDIIDRLGTSEFARLRIGIGSPPAGREPARWVLGKFQAGEVPEIQAAIERAAKAVLVWVHDGIEALHEPIQRGSGCIANQTGFDPAGAAAQ